MTTTQADALTALLAAAEGTGRPCAGRPLGYFCSYWPEELVLSVGWEPLRIWPPAGVAVPARLPAYACRPARACLAAAESREYEFLAAAGFVPSCDTMQCLAGIWPQGPTFLFVGPNALGAAGAADYCRTELARLWHRLAEAAGVEPEDQRLREAVALMNQVRSLAGRLDEMRPRLSSPLVAALLRAGQLMPRAAYVHALTAAWPELAARAQDEPARYRLLISGSLVEGDGLYTMLEELGARVVADDTCTGSRHFDGLVDEEAEPLAALAARLTGRTPCPCRHRDLTTRPNHLRQLAAGRGAQAAVLVVRKYCDPHAWDAVAVGATLRQAGYPVLVLEMETAVPGGPERTRLQAFLECLDDFD